MHACPPTPPFRLNGEVEHRLYPRNEYATRVAQHCASKLIKASSIVKDKQASQVGIIQVQFNKYKDNIKTIEKLYKVLFLFYFELYFYIILIKFNLKEKKSEKALYNIINLLLSFSNLDLN